jgi:hypothetical protein
VLAKSSYLKILAPAVLRACGSFLLLYCLTSCGSERDQAPAAPQIGYKIEREFTNKTKNKLIFDTDDSTYRVLIDGEGFTSNIPLGKTVDMPSEIALSYDNYGSYTVGLKVFLSDGTEILSDRLTWVYGPKVPPVPVVSPQREAVNSPTLNLLVSGSRGVETTELWVEGDVAKGGAWYDISRNHMVQVRLMDDEGVKKLRFKHRNLYGAESPLSEDVLVILDYTPPTNCKAEPVAEATSNGKIAVRFSADDPNPLRYRISGDTPADLRSETFLGQTTDLIQLSEGEGPKQFRVSLTDSAGNACDPIEVNVAVDKTYQSQWAILPDHRYWSDELDVTVATKFDHFAGDSLEMFVSGWIEEGPIANAWIPWQEQFTVRLSPHTGNRFVRIKWRDTAGNVSNEEVISVYLKPSIRLTPMNGLSHVVVSKIIGTESVTIRGCEEVYEDIVYLDPLPCHRTNDPLKVTFIFQDGSSLERQ